MIVCYDQNDNFGENHILNNVHYLSNRSQVSEGYKLINPAGCW